MILEKVQLFSSKKEFFFFLLACLFILSYSLLIEYNNFSNLTRFDSQIVTTKVLKQYTKTKLTKKDTIKTYQVLKLKSPQGFSFYTAVNKSTQNILEKVVTLEIWAGDINFYEYMSSFYAYSKIIQIDSSKSLKYKLNSFIDSIHEDKNISSIYKALYSATPLNKELQETFSTLGISHILAISGFHLALLASILFIIFKLPYKFLQNRYFPYRSYKVDSFIFISITLLVYLIFLDLPPSLLRAYAMLIIGFILYDRAYKIISMQTLLLSIIILLAFFPRLLFALGFWFSIAGVFYIFLFLLHFKNLHKGWQFILVPIWVYLLMLPYSLVIFSSFSVLHPLSILWTMLFTLFYPLSIFLHLVGFGKVFDTLLMELIALGQTNANVSFDSYYLWGYILLSLLSVRLKYLTFVLIIFSIFMAVEAIYQVT